MKEFNRLLPLAAAALSLAIAGCSQRSSPESAPAISAGGSTVEPVVVTDATFAEEVEKAEEPVVVVDFWATWCGPCKMIAPSLEKLSAEYAGKVKVAKVDVDKNPELSQRFKVESIPLVIMFKDGKATDSKVGALRERDYRKWFEEGLGG